MMNEIKSRVDSYLAYAIYLTILYICTVPIMIYSNGSFSEHISRSWLLLTVLSLLPANKYVSGFKSYILGCLVGFFTMTCVGHIAYSIRKYSPTGDVDNTMLIGVIFYLLSVSAVAFWASSKFTKQKRLSCF